MAAKTGDKAVASETVEMIKDTCRISAPVSMQKAWEKAGFKVVVPEKAGA